MLRVTVLSIAFLGVIVSVIDMKVLVVYDITNDSLRNKIADILKDFGLV